MECFLLAVSGNNKSNIYHKSPIAANMMQLAGYQFLEQIYCGTRTLVYRGIKESDELPVVIKLLRQEYPTFNELVQFRNQYTIAKNLDLPGVIKTYSLEPYQNGYALVMEDFGGISLKDWEEGKNFLDKKPASAMFKFGSRRF